MTDLELHKDFIQDNIDELNNKEKGGRQVAQLSDGYHTFDELYEFRKMYNAALFNEWAKENKDSKEVREGHNELFNDTIEFKPKYNVHKSWKYYDGEDCFGGGWFIVSAMLPTGLISNHYRAEDWDMFKVPEKPKALFPFDGHTSNDVLNRIKDSLLSNGV